MQDETKSVTIVDIVRLQSKMYSPIKNDKGDKRQKELIETLLTLSRLANMKLRFENKKMRHKIPKNI